jgi:hypothetical protein
LMCCVVSWGKVKVEAAIKSFKKCGISNAVDGTEDDLLRDTDDEAETDSPIQNGTCMMILSTLKARTYLTSSLPRKTNVMILKDFKYISKWFVLFYNGFSV